MTPRAGWHLGVNTLFLIPGRVGGSERYFVETLRALLPLHAGPCTLFTNIENDARLREALDGNRSNLRFDCLGFRAENRFRRILREQFQLQRRVRRAGCDALWSPGYTACLLTRCPQAVTVFDLQYRRFPEDFSAVALLATRVLVGLAVRHCREILTTSEFSRTELVRGLGIPPGRVHVTYAAAQPAFAAAPPSSAAPPQPCLLCVANSYPHKNLPALVHAFDALAARIPHRLLLVGGPGRGEPELETAIRAARHGARIERRAGLAEAELAACYCSADLFVLPSRYEGFGLPVLEAMQAGVPVVTTRGGALAEVAGTAAVYADPDVPGALEEAIMQALSRTPDERAAAIAAGRRQAAAFTWRRTAEVTYAALRAAAAAGGRTRWAHAPALLLGLVLALARPAAGAFCEFLAERDCDGVPAVADAVVHPFGSAASGAFIAVLDGSGAAVPHQAVWCAPGDPWRIRFAAVGAGPWRVRVADVAAAPVTGAVWTARAGVLLETRELPPGPAETLEDFDRLWKRGTRVLGRSEVGHIFHGLHPHGPAMPLLARYDGWLRINTAGRHRFATVTDDASFLLVNDRLVASWGGWHGIAGGERGEHGGEVTLPRGLCKLTLLHAQKDAEYLAGVYWQPPGARRPVPVPSEAFEPVGATRIAAVAASVPAQAGAAFGWEMERHFTAGGQTWVLARLRALAPADGGTRHAWRADDGATGTGPEWSHIFYTPGEREVTLEVSRDGSAAARLSRRINVHPVWLQRQEFDEEVFARLQTAGAVEAGAGLPTVDLCNAVMLADTVQAAPLLTVFGDAALNRLADFSPDRLMALYRLGYHFQSPAVRRYDAAARCWRALVASPGAPDALAARTRLHLAGLLIHSGGGLGEALALLQACRTDLLEDGERRLHQIYRGDAAAAAGDRDQAARLYLETGGTVAADDTAFEVRRAARLERARAYLRMKEYDAAESTLRALEWERPVTRMELETGLLLIEVFHQRGERQVALTHARRLGLVAPAGPRQADLLRKTVELCSEMGLNDEAEAGLRRLLEEFPYSEAAALLQERPPDIRSPGETP